MIDEQQLVKNRQPLAVLPGRWPTTPRTVFLRVLGHNVPFAGFGHLAHAQSPRSCTGRSWRHMLIPAQRLHTRNVRYPESMQVNWPTLWMSWRERELREILVLPIIVLIMLVPVGAFSGAPAHLLASLTCRGLWMSAQADRDCLSALPAPV